MSTSRQYHLVVDNNTQWFSFIIATAGDEIQEGYSMPTNLQGPFLKNIYSRPPHFTNRRFTKEVNADNFDTGMSYYGWSLSSVEFERIKLLIKLRKSVDEYENLLKY